MNIAIVTGASSGMGREMARQLPYFYREGTLDEIWVIARRKEKLESLTFPRGIKSRVVAGDLTKKKFFEKFKKLLAEKQPAVKMLVNAAGFGKSGAFAEIVEEDLEIQPEMTDLNCRALTRMTSVCLPYLKAGSRIINLASAAGFCPQPYFTVYAATKAYVLSFSQALGEELKPRGIAVTAVCPGPVDTEFFEVSGKIENTWKHMLLKSPQKVVHKALKDSRKRKSVSVYGISMKAARIAAKLIPHGMIIWIEALGKDESV